MPRLSKDSTAFEFLRLLVRRADLTFCPSSSPRVVLLISGRKAGSPYSVTLPGEEKSRQTLPMLNLEEEP